MSKKSTEGFVPPGKILTSDFDLMDTSLDGRLNESRPHDGAVNTEPH
ncbi:hypothetical protein CfE428DRAFT_6463 [Chthoniobacter flavus Ellin428]|uniref:Uncharacterized protein n=1 Tax=Chthoniobacter flavus Ellin428 TaxID=497964 RepID=B4DC22_9BACT|nr:hypothetical protein CfE428DRAFT_6463 [Chthoniobacter flavus Ellin428]TCO85253.1 hypothetical protein EV701_13253 [Chthoniobacter flavus]